MSRYIFIRQFVVLWRHGSRLKNKYFLLTHEFLSFYGDVFSRARRRNFIYYFNNLLLIKGKSLFGTKHAVKTFPSPGIIFVGCFRKEGSACSANRISLAVIRTVSVLRSIPWQARPLAVPVNLLALPTAIQAGRRLCHAGRRRIFISLR